MQVPAQVEYEKAASVEHALALLARYAPGARVLAGGHSLIPMMKLRLAQPEVLIDINGIGSLRYIKRVGGELRIGALARHADLLAAPLAGDHFTILQDAEAVIADPVVRNWGTIGGSLCQADPSEDLSAAFAALKGSMIVDGPGGSREVSARAFHTGPYETVVGPAEMLTEIRLPIRPDSGSAYLKVARRAGDWPIGAAGAAVWLAGGQITDVGAGLAIGILMDTFLVRTLLVPSMVVLLGRWNWWPSKLVVDSPEADSVSANADALGLATPGKDVRAADSGTDSATDAPDATDSGSPRRS